MELTGDARRPRRVAGPRGARRCPEGRVVVADWRCDWIGLGLAELLAERGQTVTLGVDGYMPGQRIQQYVRDAMIAAVARAGVEVHPARPALRLRRVGGLLPARPDRRGGRSSRTSPRSSCAQGHDPVDGLLTALETPGAFDGEVHGDRRLPGAADRRGGRLGRHDHLRSAVRASGRHGHLRSPPTAGPGAGQASFGSCPNRPRKSFMARWPPSEVGPYISGQPPAIEAMPF